MAKRHLKEAIERGDVNAVNQLLDSGTVDVNAIVHRNMIPLLYAIRCDWRRARGSELFRDDDITLRLISSGSDVNAKDDQGMTPLIMALHFKMGYRTIYGLINKGADVNVEDGWKLTPLHYAVKNKYNKQLIVDMIGMGADVTNDGGNNCSGSIFYRAVQNNDVEIARTLIDAGAKVDVLSVRSIEFLSGICYHNCYDDNNCTMKETIDFLIKNGADLKSTDSKGNTLIHQVDCNYLIRSCIRSGVSINAKNNDGYTPLMQAITARNVNKVNNLLSVFGADCSSIFYNDLRMLKRLFECVWLLSEMLNLLLYHGALFWECNDNNSAFDLILADNSLLPVEHEISAYQLGIKQFIKHSLLFMDDTKIDDSFIGHPRDHIKTFLSFCNECKKELIKLQNVFVKDELTFYEFCQLKRLYKSELVDISINKYKYNLEQIKVLFPIYNDILILRIKDNHIKLNKWNLLRNLENIIVKPIPVKNNENDSDVQLGYDCLYLICRNFSHKELQNLFLTSI